MFPDTVAFVAREGKPCKKKVYVILNETELNSLQGRVVQKPITANRVLKVNRSFNFS